MMREAQQEVGTRNAANKKVITVDDVRGDVLPVNAGVALGPPSQPGQPGPPGPPTEY